jgi:hypothetical protein
MACDGAGCHECENGQVQIKGCPQTYCREIVSAIGLIDLFEKGLPPISGGTLDQSVWFLEAAKVLSNEESLAKMEATK